MDQLPDKCPVCRRRWSTSFKISNDHQARYYQAPIGTRVFGHKKNRDLVRPECVAATGRTIQ